MVTVVPSTVTRVSHDEVFATNVDGTRHVLAAARLRRARVVHLSSVELAPEEETYNLVVADFHTYFVGYRKVLSHDNSMRMPTRAVVPGLRPE